MKKSSEEDLSGRGIFAIFNQDTGKGYIGAASQSFQKSLTVHTQCLRAGTHPDKNLQKGWNQSSEFKHEFIILEALPDEEVIDRKYLSDLRETYTNIYDDE